MQINSAVKSAGKKEEAPWHQLDETDPISGHKIKFIIYQTPSFVVTIDSRNDLNWCSKVQMNFAPDFGAVESNIALSENLVDRLFISRKNRLSYKKMLGSALGRILDDGKSENARKMLTEINHRILEHGKERVRMAYIYYALLGAIFAGSILIFVVLPGNFISNQTGRHPNLFQTIVCVLLGAIGSFFSTFYRFKDYKGSLVAGLSIHRLDGFLRIAYGVVAGLLISFAVKGDLIAGFSDASNPADKESIPWLLYFFAMIAGASEVFIPNLIKQTENQVGLKPPPEEESEKPDEPGAEEESEAGEEEGEGAENEVTAEEDGVVEPESEDGAEEIPVGGDENAEIEGEEEDKKEDALLEDEPKG